MCVCQIAASHQLSSVSTFVVDLTRVKRSGESVIQDDEPHTEHKDTKMAALRRSYERPALSAHRYLRPLTSADRRQHEDARQKQVRRTEMGMAKPTDHLL